MWMEITLAKEKRDFVISKLFSEHHESRKNLPVKVQRRDKIATHSEWLSRDSWRWDGRLIENVPWEGSHMDCWRSRKKERQIGMWLIKHVSVRCEHCCQDSKKSRCMIKLTVRVGWRTVYVLRKTWWSRFQMTLEALLRNLFSIPLCTSRTPAPSIPTRWW